MCTPNTDMHCMELHDPFVSKFSLVFRGLPLLVSLLHFGVFLAFDLAAYWSGKLGNDFC